MSLDAIEHIVVLVMENRSFDHLLGYRSNPNREPSLRLKAPRFSPGPHHTYEHVARQLSVVEGRPTMGGFDDDYKTVLGVTRPEMVRGYYDQETVPVYHYLADNYLVCDRWFCSVPGPTLPNRCFLWAGHSDGIIENAQLGMHLLTHHVETLFDHLSANKVSWRSYYHDVASLRFFKQFTFSLNNVSRIDRFYADAQAGLLPSVSWIDPNFTIQGALPLPGGGHPPDAANDDHPPADLRRGQQLVLDVYRALRSGPNWDKTLFILTYDEHGGFYDHVPPPEHPELAPFNNRLFTRFGVRVPTFLISPWVAKGAVTSALSLAQNMDFEHTSIAKTILDRFCPWADVSAMGERLAGAHSLRTLLASDRRDTATAPTPDELSLPRDDKRMVVGGTSVEPFDLGEVDLSSDFHRLIAGLGKHSAKTRRATT